jgi:elongation factor Ts
LAISTETIKQVREKTGAGVIDCKKALDEAGGNMDRACEILIERGIASAQKKLGRAAEQGLIETYVHGGGKIGVLVEVNCETDFVARNDQFKELAHDIALQIAAMAPAFVSKEDVPPETKCEPVTACLLQQPFIKDPTRTIQDIIAETIAKTGENIKVRRFTRFELGE